MEGLQFELPLTVQLLFHLSDGAAALGLLSISLLPDMILISWREDVMRV